MENTATHHQPEVPPNLAHDAKLMLEKTLALMGIEAKVEQFTLEGAPMLHIESPEAGRLIGKFGQTLNDLQFLLNRMLYRHIAPTTDPDARPPRVIVDIERYRERQKDDLMKIAFEAADRVRRWGDPVQMEPLNSFDRRIVHRAFAEDPEIETVSGEAEFEGGRKRITLRLRQGEPPPTDQAPEEKQG